MGLEVSRREAIGIGTAAMIGVAGAALVGCNTSEAAEYTPQGELPPDELYQEYTVLEMKKNNGVLFVSVNNPPMNVLNGLLMMELDRFATEVEADAETKVVVLQSAIDGYFISRGDARTMAESMPDPSMFDPGATKTTDVDWVHGIISRFQGLSKVTIANIQGLARGGGSEVSQAMDMRFAAIGKAVFGQPEVPMGVIPGAGGTVNLTRLVGKARALEIILSGKDFSAEQAEKYGWINRALPADEIDAFVEDLAYKIASYPSSAVKIAKLAVNASEDLPRKDGYVVEQNFYAENTFSAETKPAMDAFISVIGAEDPSPKEANFDDILDELEDIYRGNS